MKKIIILSLFFLLVNEQTDAQPYVPVATIGYSLDAIAENTTALATTSGPVDGVNVLYSQAYGALISTPYGLSNSGILSSGTKTFQLQSYTGPNVLFVPPATQDSLAFVVPAACEGISLLYFGTDVPAGGAAMDVVVKFEDNSTQVVPGVAIYDWFNTTAVSFAGGFDRANRTSGTSGGNGSAGNPRFFTADLAFPCTNQNKKIKRIIIKNTNSGAKVAILAVSAIVVPITINATASPGSLCSNTGMSSTLTMSGVSNFTWLPVGTFAGSNAATISVAPAVTTEYTVQALNAQTSTGCSILSVLTVTVYPSPVLSAAVLPDVLCVGKTATITASGAATYTWSNLATVPQTTVNPALTTSYTYSGTSQYGCISTSVVAVTVNTNSLTVSSNTSICLGNSVNLLAGGAQTYTWSAGSYYPFSPVSPTANTNYTVSGTDLYNCILSNSVAVTVNSKPNINVTANKMEVCKGESVELTASGANTYSWSSAKTGSQVTVSLPVDVAYTYTVTGTDNTGCSNAAVITVTGLYCTGIEDAGQSEATKLYPNPARTTLTLEANSKAERNIVLTDLSGRIVLSQTISAGKTEINIESLATGIYYLKVTSGKTTEVIKVLKTN